MTTVVVLLGVLGNAWGWWGLHKGRQSGRAVASTLGALALWDSGLLLSVLGYYSLAHSIPLVGGHFDPNLFASLTAVLHPLTQTCYTASSLVVLALTAQRYRAVSRPLLLGFRLFSGSVRRPWLSSAARSCRRLATVPIAISLLCLILHLPTCFEVRVGTCWSSREAVWQARPVPTRLRRNWAYAQFWRMLLVKLCLTTAGPSVAVAALSAGLLLALRRARTERVRLSSRQSREALERELAREQATSWLLLAVTLKFCASHLLPSALDIWDATTFGRPQEAHRFPAYLAVAKVLEPLFHFRLPRQFPSLPAFKFPRGSQQRKQLPRLHDQSASVRHPQILLHSVMKQSLCTGYSIFVVISRAGLQGASHSRRSQFGGMFDRDEVMRLNVSYPPMFSEPIRFVVQASSPALYCEYSAI